METDAQLKQTALMFMAGQRPAGGPYSLRIWDDLHHKTDREYRLGLELTETQRVHIHSAEGDYERREPVVIWRGEVSREEMSAVVVGGNLLSPGGFWAKE